MTVPEPNDRFSISIVSVMADIKSQITKLQDDVNTRLNKMIEQLNDHANRVEARMSKMEDWQIAHEHGDGHPALSAAVRANEKRLRDLEVGRATEQSILAERDKSRKDLEDQKDKKFDKAMTRITVALAMLTAVILLLGVSVSVWIALK